MVEQKKTDEEVPPSEIEDKQFEALCYKLILKHLGIMEDLTPSESLKQLQKIEIERPNLEPVLDEAVKLGCRDAMVLWTEFKERGFSNYSLSFLNNPNSAIPDYQANLERYVLYFKQQLESRAHPLSESHRPNQSADQSIPRMFVAAQGMKSVSETPKLLESSRRIELVNEIKLESEERKSARAQNLQGFAKSENKKLSIVFSLHQSSSEQSGIHSSDGLIVEGLKVVDNVVENGALDDSQGNISVEKISDQQSSIAEKEDDAKSDLYG